MVSHFASCLIRVFPCCPRRWFRVAVPRPVCRRWRRRQAVRRAPGASAASRANAHRNRPAACPANRGRAYGQTRRLGGISMLRTYIDSATYLWAAAPPTVIRARDQRDRVVRHRPGPRGVPASEGRTKGRVVEARRGKSNGVQCQECPIPPTECSTFNRLSGRNETYTQRCLDAWARLERKRP
jgi:hypothetical protein